MVPVRPGRRRPPGRRAPLPDPIAIRRVRVPDCLPPCEGETAAAAPDLRAMPGTAARDLQPAAEQTAGHQDDEQPPGAPGARPGLTGRAVPGTGGWPGRFAQALAETLAGSRPAQQLAPWTTEHTRQRIRELGPMLATGQRPRVRRVMTSAPAADVLEVTAVVGFGARVRVLAVRLERTAGPARGSTGSPGTAPASTVTGSSRPGRTGPGWQCTALESA